MTQDEFEKIYRELKAPEVVCNASSTTMPLMTIEEIIYELQLIFSEKSKEISTLKAEIADGEAELNRVREDKSALKKEVEGWKKEGQRLQGIEGDYLRSFLENESLKSKLKIAREALKPFVKFLEAHHASIETIRVYRIDSKSGELNDSDFRNAKEVLEQIGEGE